MSQLSQVRSRIADDINRSDLGTQIDVAINRAIEHYEKDYFWFKDKTATFSTVASQEVYTSADSGYPTDLSEIDYVEVSISSNYQYEVVPTDFKDIQHKNPGSTTLTGYPTNYALYNENMYLYPTPNGAYGITVYYQQKYTALSNDTDTNDWTTDAEDLIEARATWWILSRVIKDYQGAQVAKAEEMDALAALQAKTRKLTANGKVTRHVF